MDWKPTSENFRKCVFGQTSGDGDYHPQRVSISTLRGGETWPREFVLSELSKWQRLGLVRFLKDPTIADEKERILEFLARYVPPDWKLEPFDGNK
jgi:hypothetical protein